MKSLLDFEGMGYNLSPRGPPGWQLLNEQMNKCSGKPGWIY